MTTGLMCYLLMQADYFFVPLWDSCNHVGRGLTEYITEGVDYISSAFPYWKVAFDRHLLVSALDEGACKYNQHPELSRPKWLVSAPGSCIVRAHLRWYGKRWVCVQCFDPWTVWNRFCR